jgi:hypothetical protein
VIDPRLGQDPSDAVAEFFLAQVADARPAARVGGEDAPEVEHARHLLRQPEAGFSPGPLGEPLGHLQQIDRRLGVPEQVKKAPDRRVRRAGQALHALRRHPAQANEVH